MATQTGLTAGEEWPELPRLAEWSATRDTLQMWTQMAGKVRTALSPNVNHWWASALYVNACGLTTSAIPYEGGVFELEFDFLEHRLRIRTSRGEVKSLELKPRTVADFYAEFMGALEALGIHVKIWTQPQEVKEPIHFEKDTVHRSYDRSQAQTFWRALVPASKVFQEFRAKFIGKCSPVHFFWGSFDLAVTRFSGRRAPERPGADAITREAYSHEVVSGGFWPGSGPITEAAFYAYAVPEPEGFKKAKVKPAQAFYHEMGEFFLMYDDVRRANSPRETLLDFLQSTYEAGATLANWDRAALER